MKRGQQGQAIVLIALMLTVLIGMAAIAIDGSRAYTLRRDLQAAVDAAALAGGDKLQQTASWTAAEQAAANLFATSLRLYAAPGCSGWGSPGAAAWTVTCTYADGTVLTEVAQGLGPQGGQFTVSGRRNLQLQFARILTNGTSPALAATSTGNVNNQRYSPALGALSQSGCGGVGGNAITVGGAGTLSVVGDVVSNGSVSVSGGSVKVAGDIYARCQSTVPGAVTNACYPSGAASPCGYPDVLGATRSGFRLADPAYPAPANLGAGVGFPTAVTMQPGIYAFPFGIDGGHCWFLSGGVYTFQGGFVNNGDFASNELKPPAEPSASNNTALSTNQFWNTDGVNCAGGFQLSRVPSARDLPFGFYGVVITSVRNDVYGGVSYARESAPSMCKSVNLNAHFNAVQVDVSNVPGAVSYNIYVSLAGSGCSGPFGLAANLPVSGSVLNTATSTCPSFSGTGCTLGHESIVLDDQIGSPFAPNGSATADTTGAYPPDGETAPLTFGLPNQNPATGAAAAGDRANENNCETVPGAFSGCPGPITPGAVLFNFPSGGCLTTAITSDTYVFSGYQYNWMSLYQPASNACGLTLGAAGNTAFIGLVYAPSTAARITSPYTFEAAGVGGFIAGSITITGSMPAITFNAVYAPVPPASRLTG